MSAIWLLKQVNVGNSTNTVSGRALRGSVTGLSPNAVSDADTVLMVSVKIPATLSHLTAFDAEQLVDASESHQRWSAHVTKRRV